MMNFFGYYLLVGSLRGLNMLPLALRIRVARIMARLIETVIPSLRRISLQNIRLVFPDADDKKIKEIYLQFLDSMARFIVDCARFDTLDKEWFEKHVEFPSDKTYREIRARNPGKGVLFVGGHMGSIELQAYAVPFIGRQLNFVARTFRNPTLESWWTKRREKSGNQVIPRDGAVAKMIAALNSGKDVGILIDQNIKRKYAIFVDWFGRPAATTFAPGYALAETGAPVMIQAISYIGGDSYRVVEKECDISAIIQNKEMGVEQKRTAITQLLSYKYQELILENPGEWFWLHKRWNTTPEGTPEDFYATC